MADFELVKVQEVSAFVQRCMCRIGTNPDHAKQLAELLVAADSRGHFSHGLNRLGKLIIFGKCTYDIYSKFSLKMG